MGQSYIKKAMAVGLITTTFFSCFCGEITVFAKNEPESHVSDDAVDAAFSGKNQVKGFIGEPFYDGVIKDENDAADAIYSVIDRIGGDETTQLGEVTIRPTEDDITFYSFGQMVGDISVYGASIKLAVDKSGKAIGLVSNIIPDLEGDAIEKWAIDGIAAEVIVKDEIKGTEQDIIHGATEPTLLPVYDGSDVMYYAWVVYTNNDDLSEHSPYLAHYVTADGEYLYCMPVTVPGSQEAVRGATAAFAFYKMKESSWKGTAKDHNGKKIDIDVPTMIDEESGDEILGDAKRKILCADWTDFMQNDTLTPIVSENGKWDDEVVITYSNFVKIYDFYETTGWDGPDGNGTPMLILVNALDEEGNPMENACYSGKMQGFQTFQIDTANPFGEALDVMAHEYTHCYSAATMGSSIYFNDHGAIDEAMADIMGNLAAMMIDETDEPYIMGDKMGSMLRDMGNPNKYGQPEFVWDRYYLPQATEGTDNNDNGGVHTNSSLINIISYKLNEAGMPLEDQFYYWALVDIAMAPATDFEQLIEIMPWMMEILKFDEYLDVLNDAIDETGLKNRELPYEPPKNYGIIKTTFPTETVMDQYDTIATFVNVSDETEFNTYPERETGLVAATLEPGKYILLIIILDKESGQTSYLIPGNKGWTSAQDDDELGDIFSKGGDYTYTLKKGEVLNIDSSELYNYME